MHTSQTHNIASIPLILIITFFSVVNFLYLQIDRTPPNWDEGMYLNGSCYLIQEAFTSGPMAALKSFSHLYNGVKAPLISLFPLPFFFLFGISCNIALYSNIIFMIILNLIIFKIVAEISEHKAAILSLLVINTMPLFFGLSRRFFVEYALATMVAIWIYLLLKSDFFKKSHNIIYLGILLGFGMLTKLLFPLYIIAPTMIIIAIGLKKHSLKNYKNLLINLLIIAAIGTLIASIWYFKNFFRVIQYAFSASQGAASAGSSLGNIFSFITILKYWRNIFLVQTGWFYTALIIFLVIFTFIKKQSIRLSKLNLWIIATWFFVPFAILHFSDNKDARFLLPALPPFAIFLGILIARMKLKTLGYAALFLFPFYQFFNATFNMGKLSSNVSYQNLALTSQRIYYAHYADQQEWPIAKIVKDIYQDNKKTADYVVFFIDNQSYFNMFPFKFYATTSGIPYMKFVDIWVFHKEEFDPSYYLNGYIMKGDYLIRKSDHLALHPSNRFKEDFSQLIDSRPDKFKAFRKYDLPDNSQATVFKVVK